MEIKAFSFASFLPNSPLPTTVKVSHSEVPEKPLLKLYDLGKRQKRKKQGKKEGERERQLTSTVFEKEEQGGIKASDETVQTQSTTDQKKRFITGSNICVCQLIFGSCCCKSNHLPLLFRPVAEDKTQHPSLAQKALYCSSAMLLVLQP